MFCLTTHPTHFIYGYMASDNMIKDHTDSERVNLIGIIIIINIITE